MADIYLWIEGKQEGPYTEAQVREARTQGHISGDLPAWREGLSDWVQVDGLPGFARESSASSAGNQEGLVEATASGAQKHPGENQSPLKLVTALLPMIDRWRTNRKLTTAATADHIELSATHLVLGLKIDWINRTLHSITIKDIQVAVSLSNRNEEPLRFYPLERFGRSHTGRGYQTTPLCTFTLPSQQNHTEHLRFISQQVLDIPAGNYSVEFFLKDIEDILYNCGANLQIENEIKHRQSESP